MCDINNSIDGGNSNKKKSQIFKKKLDITYIIQFFINNFKVTNQDAAIDISYIEQKYTTLDCVQINNTHDINDYVLTLHINKVLYRKMKYHELIQPFFDYMKDYYYKSKQTYATKQPTYKSFITIIRQICKYFGFQINSNIKYTKSTYELNYDISI